MTATQISTTPSVPDTAPTSPVTTTDGTATDGAASTERAAAKLLGSLAADAVRRDPRVLSGLLDGAAPWAEVLPPAAHRAFATELGHVLQGDSDDPIAVVEPVLARWAGVAARFA